MAVLPFKAASRAVIRRSHLPHNHPHLTKRHNTNTTNPTTRPADVTPTANIATTTSTIPIPNTIPTIPIWQRLGPLSRAFQAYGRSQRKRPYATQFASSLVIYFLGDLSAQNINGDEYDPKRTLRALFISAGSSIPSYKWFVFSLQFFTSPCFSWKIVTSNERRILIETEQVHLSTHALQLHLPTSFPLYKGFREPSCLHTHLQYLFLWNAIPSLIRFFPRHHRANKTHCSH